MKLNAGVIGLRFGATHAAAYRQNPHTELSFLCDTDSNRLNEVSDELGVSKTTADYRELLDDESIQIVSIATPDMLHREMAVAALEAGKHVLCEKPMALTMDDCSAIVQAADSANTHFMVGQVCRFAPGFVLTHSLVQDGLIGNLFLVESEYAHNYTSARGVGDWRLHPLRHPFIGGACHAVDLLRWIAGNAVEVHAYANHFTMKEWPNDDCIVANMKFESGVVGRVMCSIGCQRPYTMRSCFYGDAGTIISTNTEDRIQVFSTKYPSKPAFWDIPVDISSHNVVHEVATLVDCIRAGKRIQTDAREGARTVCTCLAVIESSRSGQPVRVADIVS